MNQFYTNAAIGLSKKSQNQKPFAKSTISDLSKNKRK